MVELVTYGILVVGGVFLVLTTWIVINKARRESIESFRREHRLVLEPQVLAYAHGKNGSLAGSLEIGFDARERSVLEMILLDHARLVRGIERGRLARALDELGFVDGYLESLEDSSWWRRAEAAEKLGLSGAQRALLPLARALDDPVAEVRMRAANALGRLGGKASARQLIRVLGQPSRWSVIRVADILSRMGPHVVDELTHVFPELSLPGKLAALDVLARIRPLGSARWLIGRLADPQRDVRARSCKALGSLGDPVAGPALIEALGDTEWPVRSMAAKALGRMGHGAAIPALCRALRDPQWWVRSNAADALKAMGPRGAESLERMVEDEDRYARHQVVLKLQEMGVVDQRIKDLVRPPGDRRAAAESLVLRMVAAGRTARLRALATGHADWRVRRALHVLLPPESGAA